MLITTACVLLIVWLLGVTGMYPLGGFVYILPTLAAVMIAIRLIRGQ